MSSQGYGFSRGHIWMWELDYKESWVPKNWPFWTVVLEKTLESSLDCKERDQSWVFIGRTDDEAETPILWPPDVKSWLTGKDPDAGTDWGQEEKRMTEDEMVEWHHRINGHGFGWTLGVGDRQGGLVCCSPWGCKELDTTGWSNWTEVNMGSPGGSDGKESAYNAGDPASIPGWGRSPGKGNGIPLQYSCLENPIDGGAWWATVHEVAKCRTWLSDFTSLTLP